MDKHVHKFQMIFSQARKWNQISFKKKKKIIYNLIYDVTLDKHVPNATLQSYEYY